MYNYNDLSSNVKLVAQEKDLKYINQIYKVKIRKQSNVKLEWFRF